MLTKRNIKATMSTSKRTCKHRWYLFEDHTALVDVLLDEDDDNMKSLQKGDVNLLLILNML